MQDLVDCLARNINSSNNIHDFHKDNARDNRTDLMLFFNASVFVYMFLPACSNHRRAMLPIVRHVSIMQLGDHNIHVI